MNKELMKKINNAMKTQKYDEEVVKTLLNISITAKLLAKMIIALKDEIEEDEILNKKDEKCFGIKDEYDNISNISFCTVIDDKYF